MKFKIFLLLLASFLLASLGIASLGAKAATLTEAAKFKSLKQKNLEISIDSQTKNLIYLSGAGKNIKLTKNNLKTKLQVGQQFLKDYGKYFGVNNFSKDLGLLKENRDDLGFTHLVYEQKYNGISVYGGSLAVHLDKDSAVSSASGRIISSISINTKPKISQAKSISLVKEYAIKKLGMAKPRIKQSKLYVYDRSVLSNKIKSKKYLAYFFEVIDDQGDGRKLIFLNAQDGQVIDQFEGNKTVINREVYDCNTGGGCWDAIKGKATTSTAMARTEGDAIYNLKDTDDLYNMLGQAHQYYSQMFGLNGANDLGGIGSGAAIHPADLTVGLSYYTQPDYCLNASWFGGWGMKFCEDAITYSIVGHEYGHAIDDYQVNNNFSLIYEGEQGAIDEAWADVWGQALQRYANNATSSNWHIGSLNSVFRDLIDPEVMDDPDTYYDNNFECHTSFTKDNDYGAVHKNSTIISHAAYLMSVGGDKNGCTISGIGQEKVERIFFKALHDYFLAGMTFNMANDALRESCQELYGEYSYECVQVRNALRAVYLNQPGACSGIKLESPKCEVSLSPEIIRQMAENVQSRLKILPNISDRVNGEIFNTPNTEIDSDDLPEVQAPALVNELPSVSVPDQAPISTPAPKPISTPAPEPEVRTPSFDIVVEQNDKYVIVKGTLNYYGKGAKCSGPRYFDPIIVRWGQADSQPVLQSDNTFTASHTYTVKNKSYDLSVSVVNSCFGSHTFHKTLYFSY